MTENANFMTTTPSTSNHGKSYVEPDLLSESLALLRIRGHVGSRTEAKGAWGLQLPASDSYFHVIERGNCWLQLNDAKGPIRLDTGDAVILPHGHAHRLSDAPGRKAMSLAKALETQCDGVVRLGSEGPMTGIVCGAFRFDGAAGHPLLESLPPLLHVSGAGMQAVELKELQRFLIHEVRHPRHAFPAREWTVSDLAAQAGISRSGLSALFRQVMGVSPMAYLARWRLLLAARVLRDEGLSVREAADRVGYQADVAFSRAFKRQFGVAPGTYRQHAAAAV
jgi:AraC-like DNA-binding protein